ncbi:MAG TPA: type II toxin-antitoxin system VapC family toxin [Albitalea sp.]|uniref:type II toxin-antitoxin system VapC family toxin n=1 Tax=Piscinibacter sp. TaxID=1903157 RepID=UPI002ED273C6
MILVDTSVWVDHLRRGDARLAALLDSAAVIVHPFIVGEIACGSLSNRKTVLELLQDLPAAVVADAEEVLAFIDRHRLHGKGIGYVDVHLLAAVALTQGAKLWTRDKRLRAAAQDLGYAHEETASH